MRKVVVVSALASACYSPTFPEHVPCGPNRACPNGQACIAGICNGTLDAASTSDTPVDAQITPLHALAGQQFLLPCSGGNAGATCSCVTHDKQLSLHGDAFKTYMVKLRVRGVIETIPIFAGQAGPGGWTQGGQPLNTTNSIFMMTISSPAENYWLNRGVAAQLTSTIDYEASVAIAGDAEVLFHADGQDGKCLTNAMGLTLPGVVTMPQPYSGQFLQLDVVSVAVLRD